MFRQHRAHLHHGFLLRITYHLGIDQHAATRTKSAIRPPSCVLVGKPDFFNSHTCLRQLPLADFRLSLVLENRGLLNGHSFSLGFDSPGRLMGQIAAIMPLAMAAHPPKKKEISVNQI
jgi:hypothetical protein